MNRSTTPFLTLLLISIGFFHSTFAQTAFPHDTRSDSISIERYDVHLDLKDFSTFILKGHIQVIFEPKVNNITEIKVALYPNPVNGFVSVESENANRAVEK